jgi:hypothetical protein
VGLLPTPSLSSGYKSPDGQSFLSPLCITFPHHSGKLPPASHHVEVPFIDSSHLAYLCDLALLLPQVSSLESSSFALPDASRARRPPAAGESCFPLPLVTSALLLHVPHTRAVLVQLENQARGTSSSSSHLSASTLSVATELSSAPMRIPFPSSPSSFWCSGATTVFPSPFSITGLGFKPPSSSAPHHACWTYSGVVTAHCRALAQWAGQRPRSWAGQAGPGLPGQLWPWAAVSPQKQCVFPISFGLFE